MQRDILFRDDLMRAKDDEKVEAVSRQIERQQEWFRLTWFQQLFTPVPASWYKHYIHGEGAYTGGD